MTNKLDRRLHQNLIFKCELLKLPHSIKIDCFLFQKKFLHGRY